MTPSPFCKLLLVLIPLSLLISLLLVWQFRDAGTEVDVVLASSWLDKWDALIDIGRLDTVQHVDEFRKHLLTAVASNDYCSRRHALARASGLVDGFSWMDVSLVEFPILEFEVKMGSDDGEYVFVPNKLQICSGDIVRWTQSHNSSISIQPDSVDFDDEYVPDGKISVHNFNGTLAVQLTERGTYGYISEPDHRMTGEIVVL